MNKPITYWLPNRVAAPLADEYGEVLEHMPKNEKLLLINILSGVLHELETNPCEEFTAEEYIHEQGIPDETVGGLKATLTQFDQYDASTIEAVVMVLAIAVTEQR
jgi:hypothetical protein